jgi:5-methylcytosine-specific restriction protein B
MRKELNNLGVIVNYPGVWQSIPNSRLFLTELLSQNNYSCNIINEDGCKWTIELKNDVIKYRKTFNIYLGNIRNESRNDKEKKIQLNSKDPRIHEQGIENIILGVYCYESSDLLKDYTIAAWAIDQNTNYQTNPSIRGINIDLFQQAKFKGFVSNKFRDNIVYCFRPEFIHYYLLNKDSLHETQVKIENENDESNPSTDQPLNQILYGPPGTGKTHNAINYALSIVKGNDVSGLSRNQIKMEFDSYIESGQIQFVTFHQSYSYEEFVEGIKPIVNDKGDVEYQIVDGIFKRLCWHAENNYMLEVGDQFQNSRNGIFTISKYNSHIIEITREEGSIITFPTDLIVGLLKLIEEKIIDISNIQSREKDGVPLQELLDKKFDKYIFGYDSIIKALIEFINSKNRTHKKNYVLIIDEINRGNISKIFGELITLIEDSKRIGTKESLSAKLTYSGINSTEMFGVPNNLYILGTMNTADRSITNIDTALRRRFVFEEFPPLYDLPEIGKVTHSDKEINLQDVLRIINERIEYLLDRDHLIGHSYFIGITDWDTLCSKFRNNIIPLLQEYFYNDWEKIALVLGDNDSWHKNDDEKFILKKKYPSETLFGKNNNLEEEFDENQYYINPKLVDKKYNDLSVEFFIKGFQSKS